MKSRSGKVRKGSRASVAITVGEAQDGAAFASWKKDLIAGAIAVAAAGAIVANAAFLQTGQHPAPMFFAKPAPASSPKSIRVVGQEVTGPALPRPNTVQPNAIQSEPQKIEPVALPRPRADGAPQRPPQLASAERHDPIGELIAPSSKRVLAVQKALADYGFGQIRPNGTMGPETKSAIEQFERSRKLPVTGQISPRLVRELSALTGRPVD
ncbi:MAG: peptidoglycan-binding protein [Pseudorhodoplanes sp.]|jgi:hypothetical protein